MGSLLLRNSLSNPMRRQVADIHINFYSIYLFLFCPASLEEKAYISSLWVSFSLSFFLSLFLSLSLRVSLEYLQRLCLGIMHAEHQLVLPIDTPTKVTCCLTSAFTNQVWHHAFRHSRKFVCEIFNCLWSSRELRSSPWVNTAPCWTPGELQQKTSSEDEGFHGSCWKHTSTSFQLRYRFASRLSQ